MAEVVPSIIANYINKEFQAAELEEAQIGCRSKNHFLSGLVGLLDKLSDRFFIYFDQIELSDFILAKSIIEWNLNHTLYVDPRDEPIIRKAYFQSIERNINPVSLIYNLLLKCKDQAPSQEHKLKLNFIDDKKLKDDLRIDISSAETLFNTGEWKAATVMAGSVAEALLLWGLKKKLKDEGKVIPADINNWDFGKLMDEALINDLIPDKKHRSADQAREFRNLIHPGKEIREKFKCTRGTAHGAASAVWLIVEEFKEKFGKT